MGLIKKDELAKEYIRPGNSEAALNSPSSKKSPDKKGVALAADIAAEKVGGGGTDGSAGNDAGGGGDGDAAMEDADGDAELAAAMALSMEGGNGGGGGGGGGPKTTAGVGLPADFRGNYRIFALVTHKGRSSDAGHYMVRCFLRAHG